MTKEECKHEFTHVSNEEQMVNQYKTKWVASRVIIYCKKCGTVTMDSIENDSGI